MKQVGALFKAPMVRAILREIEKPGTGKTQTRRLLYVPRKGKDGIVPASATFMAGYREPSATMLPITHFWTLGGWQRRKPGDLLWVKETWRTDKGWDSTRPIHIPDFAPIWFDADGPADFRKMTPGMTRVAIHLPQRFSRITCIVESVKIERLRAITDDDAIAEGWHPETLLAPRAWYQFLWNSINVYGRWEDNPWVVCTTFRPVLENVAAVAQRKAA